MHRNIAKIMIGLCFIYGASRANSDVEIVINQTPLEPISFQSAVNSCNDTWNRMTKGDRELENLFVSRFGSKRTYLRKCADDLVEADQQELRLPVKEVYCQLEAYQKTIEAFYDKLEGNLIDWKMFRSLTVMYSTSSNCMNEDIPNS